MLRKRITFYITRQLDLDKLVKEICDVINHSIKTDNPALLDEWFGPITFKDCLDKQEREQREEEVKKNEDDLSLESIAELMESDYRSIYFVIGFYMACLRGNIPIVAHYIKKGNFPGDVDRGFSPTLGLEHFGLQESLKGPPLVLAIRSGNLDLVKYIYENTNAMAETSLEPPREPTALMEAVKLGHADIVEYLLAHSANANARIPYGTSPLLLAIDAKNITIIRSLVNAGAIVTTSEVHKAIRQGVSLEIIDFLFLNCVNRENLYKPFLLSALESGDVNFLLALEKHPLVSSFDEIGKFNDGPIHEMMVSSAAGSGSVEMMKHLQDVRKVPLAEIFANDLVALEQQAVWDEENKRDQTSYERITNIMSRHLYVAAVSGSNYISLLAYLCETLGLKLNEKMIKTFFSLSLDKLKVCAYLFRFLEKPPAPEAVLNDIAFRLEKLSLGQLFQLYNCPLIVNGNHFGDNSYRGFREQIAALIKEKESQLDVLAILRLIKSDKEAATGALFYYCTYEFNKHSERLIFLLTQLTSFNGMFKNVNIQDCRGDSLAQFAHSQRSLHLVKLLLARGANPDLPGHKGETLLYRILYNSRLFKDGQFEEAQNFVTKVTHTLRYLCKEWLAGADELKALLSFTNGEIHDATIAELIAACLPERNAWQKLRVLFIHLSEANAKAMVALFKDDRFIEKQKLSKETIDGFISMFNEVKTDKLSADDKARRLSAVTVQVTDRFGFFNAQEKIVEKESKADKAAAVRTR